MLLGQRTQYGTAADARVAAQRPQDEHALMAIARIAMFVFWGR